MDKREKKEKKAEEDLRKRRIESRRDKKKNRAYMEEWILQCLGCGGSLLRIVLHPILYNV
jgi:hypothetical protein